LFMNQSTLSAAKERSSRRQHEQVTRRMRRKRNSVSVTRRRRRRRINIIIVNIIIVVVLCFCLLLIPLKIDSFFSLPILPNRDNNQSPNLDESK
jgi:hypothetical protein